MVTGVLLAVARISGETAPLLFTALNNQFWSTNLNAPMASLPVVIFQFALSPYEDWQKLAWTGALIITFAVLALSIIARAPRRTEKISHERRHPFSASRPSPTRRSSTAGLAEKVIDPQPRFLLRRQPRAEEHQPARSTQSKVTAFIGPSGCGKSTLLRVLNRMYDLYPNQRADRARCCSTARTFCRRRRTSTCCARAIGMVFQKPTPFPMTIYENIAFGIRLYERLPKSELDDRVRDRAAARRAVGRGQGQARRQRARASPAASSSACASRAPSRCGPR